MTTGDKIGDYIHYKYDNYLQHGTSVNGNQGINPNSIFRWQRKKILNEIKNQRQGNKEQDRKTIQEQLEFVYGKSNQTKTIGNITYTSQQIRDKLLDKINQSLTGEAIITETMHPRAGILSEFRRRADLNLNQTRFKTESLQHRFNIIDTYLRKIEKKTELTEREKAFKFWYDLLEKEINNLSSDLLKNNLITLRKGNFSKYYISSQDTHEAYQLQTIVELLSFAYLMVQHTNLSKIAGDVEELVVGFSNYVASVQTTKTLDELLDEYLAKPVNVVGSDTIQKVMVSSQFAVTGIGQSNFLAEGKSIYNGKEVNYFRQIGDNSVEIKALQDKVDVRLENINGNTHFASVKNYNLNRPKNITILSGRNLLMYLQEYPIFLNHYLNITSHKITPAGDSKVPMDKVLIENRTLFMTMPLKAMAGGLLSLQNGQIGKSQMADMFIVNDSNSGNVQVHFIEDFISLLDKFFLKIEQFIKISDFDIDKQWIQIWVDDSDGGYNRRLAYRRILNILLQLQRQSLHISIPSDSLAYW